MDASRFDTWTRSWSEAASRRRLFRAALGTVGLSALLPDGIAATRTNRGRKRQKPKKNAFGCLNVGQKCRGKDAKCCSGICQGKRPKKGKRDRSRCVGHDESSCLPGQQTQICGGNAHVACTSSAGRPGACNTTTGNAAYCSADGNCFACKRDVDCQPFCGPQATCFQCAEYCSAEGGTACGGVDTCSLPP